MYRSSSFNRFAVPLMALAAGAAGAHIIEHSQDGPSTKEKTNLRQTLQPSAVKIGQWALNEAKKYPKRVSISRKSGEWGDSTIVVQTSKTNRSGEEIKTGYLSVGMERNHGRLDPSTTFGVEVNIQHPGNNSSAATNTSPLEEIFIVGNNISSDGAWETSGQINSVEPGGGALSISANGEDPNLLNSTAAANKALALAQAALELPVVSTVK